MFKTTTLMLLASLVFSSAAFALDETEANKLVSVVAINNTLASVAVKSPGASSNCFFTLMAFDFNTTLGRLFYAILLDAKANQTPVDLSYTRNGNSCTLTQVVAR